MDSNPRRPAWEAARKHVLCCVTGQDSVLYGQLTLLRANELVDSRAPTVTSGDHDRDLPLEVLHRTWTPVRPPSDHRFGARPGSGAETKWFKSAPEIIKVHRLGAQSA